MCQFNYLTNNFKGIFTLKKGILKPVLCGSMFLFLLLSNLHLVQHHDSARNTSSLKCKYVEFTACFSSKGTDSSIKIIYKDNYQVEKTTTL